MLICVKTTMKYITKFLKKCFGSLRTKLSFKFINHILAKCAKSRSYIETFSKHADSVHHWIKSSYEEDFKRSFELCVREIIRKLRVTHAEIAIDITHEPFYGTHRDLHVFNTQKEKKYRGEYQYITCCLINKGKEIPLMALPVRLGEQTKLTIELLEYCISLFKNIKYVLFDRGFYVAEIIDFLTAKNINYQMLVPKHKGKLLSYVDETETLKCFNHQMRYSKKKSVWKPVTRIVVCKNIFDFDWIFATNLNFKTAKDYVLNYKRRWQIETNYRVEDEAKIKSKSSNYLIRFFYFLTSQLFHLCWILHKKESFYVQFKKYLDILEQKLLFEFLRISSI